MDRAVSEAWIEVVGEGGERERFPLAKGLTTIGGRKGAIPVEGTGSDQLHLWDDPYKLVFVGSGEVPLVNGAAAEECALHDGDSIEWRGVTLEFACPQSRSAPAPAPAAARSAPAPVKTAPSAPSAAPAALGPIEELLWRRVQAGIAVELGLADAETAKRWQRSIQRNEYDADSCARELLASVAFQPGDPRLFERTAKLERDLVMAPVKSARTTRRRTRKSPGGWFALLVAQFLLLAISCVIVFVVLFLVRQRWEWSVDKFLDDLSDRVSAK
jgi:hypothetical protein